MLLLIFNNMIYKNCFNIKNKEEKLWDKIHVYYTWRSWYFHFPYVLRRETFLYFCNRFDIKSSLV